MNKFKAARQAAGLTAYDAARKLGVTHPALYMWETGRSKPNGENLVRAARLYGVSTEYLMEEESNERKH